MAGNSAELHAADWIIMKYISLKIEGAQLFLDKDISIFHTWNIYIDDLNLRSYSTSGLKIAIKYLWSSYLGHIMMDFASIWLILKLGTIIIYSRTEKDRKTGNPRSSNAKGSGFGP